MVIFVRQAHSNLRNRRMYAALRGFLATARLSCYSCYHCLVSVTTNAPPLILVIDGTVTYPLMSELCEYNLLIFLSQKFYTTLVSYS